MKFWIFFCFFAIKYLFFKFSDDRPHPVPPVRGPLARSASPWPPPSECGGRRRRRRAGCGGASRAGHGISDGITIYRD